MNQILINSPDWLIRFEADSQSKTFSEEARSLLAIEVSRKNLEFKTGGPFGAAVFEDCTGRLLALGNNMVVTQNQSMLHAEVTAIMRAQNVFKNFDLSSTTKVSLYASGQPCCMCMGAIWWSGVQKLVYCASASEIERITGFKEGPLPEDWRTQYQERKQLPPIEVVGPIMQQVAAEVLQTYVDQGGFTYNAGSK
ncbi:MAG: nucleoside deaminase [Bdellovibrionota bacterium]